MKERIAQNLQAIHQRMTEAAARVHRNPEEIRLVAVTKSVGVEEILALYEAGVRHFAENRLDTALEKIRQCPEDIQWHYLAPVQSRKTRDVVAHFSVVEAVDRLKVAEVLQQRCAEQERSLAAYLEVNVSGESTKHGFESEVLSDILPTVQAMDRLTVKGLMTMAPFGASEEVLRRCFGTLKALSDSFGLPGCSMGMTDDFEIAIEEGSTEVRIGRALFE